jgi:site-specific recombinase XerD
MAKIAKPRWRADKNAWYGQVGGVRHTLAHGKKNLPDARKKLAELLREVGQAVEAPSLMVGEIAELRLTWLKANRGARTLRDSKWYLRLFVERSLPYGRMQAADVRPFHVQEWLGHHPAWGDQTRYHAITVVKSTFNWAVKQGYLKQSPIATLERPRATRRLVCTGAKDLALILPWVRSDDFREYLTVLSATGARPSEIARLEASHLRAETMTATMDGKTTAKTGRQRVIWFPTDAWSIVVHRARERPSGLLFMTEDGNAWGDFARSCQVRSIRARAKKAKAALPEFDCYSLRHGFVTDALERGLTSSEVAALVGNSAAVIEKTYDHLSRRQPAMRSALDRARPVAGGSPKPARRRTDRSA